MPTSVDLKYINSAEYRNRFNGITGDEELDELLHKKAVDMLTHRNNSDYEDMYWISKTDKVVKMSQTHSKAPRQIDYTEAIARDVAKRGRDYITIHNHPNNAPPSGSDFGSAWNNKYHLGVTVGNNGSIYSYTVGKNEVSVEIINMTIEKYKKREYNAIKAHEIALGQLVKDYGIEWRKH